ncbi:MAG TPA: hypothetical protein VF550_20895 [Polyangia bacterium]
MNPVLLLTVSAAVCPASAPVPDTPGFPAVAKLPATEAMRLNGEGKQLYRQERWDEAREKYWAALVADPDFLGAQLNAACSFSRQGRYAEAADEAANLIRRAFVPWNREVLEAADLGILQDQAVYAKVQARRAEAALGWGKLVGGGILFVARTKPPLRVAGQGVLVLGLNQELFAWIPETGRYLQVTAEDGRILAFTVSSDGGRIAYVLAGKLLRSPGQAALLRGLTLRVLDIPTMSVGKAVPIPGDVKKVKLWLSSAPTLRVTDASSHATVLTLVDDRLEPAPAWAQRWRGESVEASGAGVEPGKRRVAKKNCGFRLASEKDSTGRWHIVVSRPGSKSFSLDARYGAGLAGLPFPDGTPGLEQSTGKP